MDNKMQYWYEYDLETREKLASKYQNVSITALHLSTRAKNALLKHDPAFDIAKLLRSGHEIQRIRGLGEKSFNEINEKLLSILSGKQISFSVEDIIYPKREKREDDGADNLKEPRYWYEYDLATRKQIAEKFRNVSIRALQLTSRPINALFKYDPTIDIAKLIYSGDEIQQVRGLGLKSFSEINKKLLAILAGEEIVFSVDDSTLKHLDDETTALAARLPDFLRKQRIEVLQLPKRVQDALIRVGIETIGDIEQATADELAAIPGISQRRIMLIYERIHALKQHFDEQKQQVDWDKVWESQGFMLIPEDWPDDLTDAEIWRNLPKVIRQVCLLDSNERGWIIISRRFNLKGEPKLTLEELGVAFNLTRERVRQIESGLIQLLQSFFLKNDFSGKKYHIRFQIIEKTRACLKLIIQQSINGIRESELQQMLVGKCGIPLDILSNLLDFLLELSDARKIRVRGIEPVIFNAQSNLPRNPEAVFYTIHRFLASRASSASDVDILIEVNKRLKKKERVSLPEIRRFLRLCSSVESVPNGLYRSKFERLETRILQVERILLDGGEPMTVSEICREINRRLVLVKGKLIDERNLVNQISQDDRFTPIGRSGYWALKQWEVETATIVEIMKQYLASKNSPATVGEIVQYVQQRRPASEASITSYLAFNPAFSQIDGKLWGLSSWQEVQSGQWDVRKVASFIEDFFQKRGTDRIEYKILKQELMKETGFSERRVQGMLNANPAVKTVVIDYKTRLAVFQSNYKEILDKKKRRRKRRKKTVFEMVSADVRSILESSPGRQLGLKELIDRLSVKHGHRYKHPYQPLYSFISRMDFVEKIHLADSNLVVCRLKSGKLEKLQEKAAKVRSQELRENILRSLTYLTEDDVDVALFLLSKEFEGTLQKYLKKAIEAGKFPNKSPKRFSLHEMISFIKREGIITDDAVLSFLRQQRNLRAHGAMPSIEERKIMFLQADVTAGMYIDYIKFFDDLIHNLNQQ